LNPGGSRLIGVGAMALGALFVTLALRGASTRSTRTRYRRMPWTRSDWILVAGGIAVLLGGIAQSRLDGVALLPSTNPPEMPQLPIVTMVALAIAYGCAVFSGGAAKLEPAVTP
jgi:energy-coupling factor transport system permease protein